MGSGGKHRKRKAASEVSDDESSTDDRVKSHKKSRATAVKDTPPTRSNNLKVSKHRTRERESDDDSDTDAVPTVKKPKMKDTRSAVHRSEEGSYIDLGKKKRVTVQNFKGSPLIQIREYYVSGDEEKPGKKGIALNPEQWEIIKSNIDTIDQLLSDLQK
ncbi:hypothetical protein AX17_005614 [Amanita inopinata Kibby_2008]|nr:hypothetical protein AX17_005614 [Amanita inopinata Kibby_2008]